MTPDGHDCIMTAPAVSRHHSSSCFPAGNLTSRDFSCGGVHYCTLYTMPAKEPGKAAHYWRPLCWWFPVGSCSVAYLPTLPLPCWGNHELLPASWPTIFQHMWTLIILQVLINLFWGERTYLCETSTISLNRIRLIMRLLMMFCISMRVLLRR